MKSDTRTDPVGSIEQGQVGGFRVLVNEKPLEELGEGVVSSVHILKGLCECWMETRLQMVEAGGGDLGPLIRELFWRIEG